MSARSPRGFTLIELTIALSIAAVMFAAVTYSLGAITGTKAKSSAGELGGVIRSLYDTAALTGKTCRLVFALPGKKDEDTPAKYWAECAAGNVTSRKDRDEALQDAMSEADHADENKKRKAERAHDSFSSTPTVQEMMAVEKERVENAAKFSQFTSPEIESRELPLSVKLSVWTRHQREPVTSGLAYLYFFPQGFTEKAQLYVRQGKNVWTLSVAPLTGKTSVVGEELEVPRS